MIVVPDDTSSEGLTPAWWPASTLGLTAPTVPVILCPAPLHSTKVIFPLSSGDTARHKGQSQVSAKDVEQALQDIDPFVVAFVKPVFVENSTVPDLCGRTAVAGVPDSLWNLQRGDLPSTPLLPRARVMKWFMTLHRDEMNCLALADEFLKDPKSPTWPLERTFRGEHARKVVLLIEDTSTSTREWWHREGTEATPLTERWQRFTPVLQRCLSEAYAIVIGSGGEISNNHPTPSQGA